MFSDFLIFIKNHYELIGSIILVLLSFILTLVKKKPSVDLMHYVYMALPEAIRNAEKTDLKGEDKLFYALRSVIDICKQCYNLTISHRDYSQIMLLIEDILNTPQKKK